MWGRHWLLVGMTACAVAIAGPPPSAAPPAPQGVPQSPPGAQQSPPQGAPDEDFIEFLGADDTGDAAWWEFLKKVPPREGNPPPAPQETR